MRKRRITCIITYLLLLAFSVQCFSAFAANSASASTRPTISKKSQNILVGEKYNFNINGKIKSSTYKWESSDTAVATVNQRGIVTGVSKGKATVTCKVITPKNEYLLTADVTVREPAESIEINNKIEKIYVGEKYNLNKTRLPETSNDKITWTTSDRSIAKPDKNGIFTALKAGQVTITASTLSGKKDSVTIRVLDESNSLTLTKDSVENGKIMLSDVTYDYITIENSVGNAEIVLDSVTINDTLEMEAGAEYTVRAIDSEINRVVSLEESNDKISSFSVSEDKNTAAPTFVAESGTLVVTVDARGNVSVIQEGTAEIGMVKVNRKADGSIEVSLEGFSGNLVVNTASDTNIAIVTNNCNIPEATVSGTASGQLTMKDNTTNGNESSIGKIKIESSTEVKIDIPAKEVEIADTTSNANVTIEKPVEKLVNKGSATNLTVNSSITSISSTGNELNMKVAAGSTVKEVEIEGESSEIDVALGSTIENVVAKGDESSITGRGKVNTVTVEGNNTKIETNGTSVSVGEGVTGTVKNGQEVEAGTSVTPTPVPTSAPISTITPTPTPPLIPETGEKITINNPGNIWAGTEVQMTADYDNIKWYVYNNIENYGYANIDTDTGVFSPVNAGTVRVVAISTLNPEVYGAVDVVIQAKKFVRIEPLDDVIIDSDQGLISIEELIGANILPDKVDVVYETGNGTETEIITLDIYSWHGDYDGLLIGDYVLRASFIVPLGYEQLYEPYASFVVKVRVSQSDNRINITGYVPIDPIVITGDEHLLSYYHLYMNYLKDQCANLILSNGEVLPVPITNWSYDAINIFNGEPGEYSMQTYIDIPGGYANKKVFYDMNYVGLNYNKYIIVPINIIIQTAQTPEYPYDYEMVTPPDTTQPIITPSIVAASIESVTISGHPEIVYAGEVIDFNDYLTVTTDSDRASDKRVNWSDITYNYSYNGQYMFCETGTFKIRATSIIDSSKFDEVTIQVVNGKKIISCTPFNDINVNENMGICNIKTAYDALEDLLPTAINALTDNGDYIRIAIIGWDLMSLAADKMVLSPRAYIPKGYDLLAPYPEVTVNFNTAQQDNRVTVVSGSAITANITLDEDKHATSLLYLLTELYPSKNIMINAVLEDGSTAELLCEIETIAAVYVDELYYIYDGTKGNVILRLGLLLPNGYKTLSTDLDYDLLIEVELDITVNQTSVYEVMWVMNKPAKMSYNVGEDLDLTGILVRISDSAGSDIYIGVDKFLQYGLEMHLGTVNGRTISTTESITADMNYKYIFIHNTINDTYAFFGPITVTSND